MEQKELYDLANKLTDKEVVYLLCAHMEHINKSQFNFNLNANGGNFIGNVVFKERREEKGYLTNNGYMGWIGDRYMLFSTEQGYIEYMEES